MLRSAGRFSGKDLRRLLESAILQRDGLIEGVWHLHGRIEVPGTSTGHVYGGDRLVRSKVSGTFGARSGCPYRCQPAIATAGSSMNSPTVRSAREIHCASS